MQRGGDRYRVGCQSAAVASTRQPQSPPLHFPVDSNRSDDMDVQASPPEVSP